MAPSKVSVRIFTYRSNPIDDSIMPDLVQLAYKTATDQGFVPTEILIRAVLHDTTMGGPDPKGYHGTFSFKYKHLPANEHISAHGYTPGKNDYRFVEATFGKPQADSTARKSYRKSKTAKVVWPGAAEVKEYDDSPVEFLAPEAKGTN